MNSKFSIERFRRIVAAYGARPESWPEAEREAVMAASDHPEFADILRDAEQLDAMLDSHRVPGAGAALFRRVAATIPSTNTPPRRRDWWLPGTAVAATALAGLVAGALLLPVAMDGALASSNDRYALGYSFWDVGEIL